MILTAKSHASCFDKQNCDTSLSSYAKFEKKNSTKFSQKVTAISASVKDCGENQLQIKNAKRCQLMNGAQWH